MSASAEATPRPASTLAQRRLPTGAPTTATPWSAGRARTRPATPPRLRVSLKYDSTKPQASPSARPTDKNGWYNHSVIVNYQGADATSGIDSCTQTTYSGPDDPSTAVGGTCTDKAGNQSGSSLFTLKYDETAPQASATASRGPDVNAWYNHDLTVSFSGSDATSGLDICDAPATYSGPDSTNAVVSGTCRDFAGNTITRSLALKYDETAPQATATPDRQPNAKGWYRAGVTVTFAGTDATSGLASCVAPKDYSGPDSANASVGGTCLDQAGNVGSTSFGLKYDATAPLTTASPSRQPNANGWFNASLAVSFAGTDATAGIDSCDAPKAYAGPDTLSTAVTGACRDNAGNSGPGSYTLKYDATNPSVTAAAARQPNANGWYNASVGVNFTGGDATSGIDSCDASKTYAGPDNANASVAGDCHDKAGNSGTGSLSLKYDATAPVSTATPDRQPNANGWYRAPVTVTFGGADATSGLDSCDAAKTYSGPDTQSHDAERRVPGQGRELERRFPDAEVRRDGARFHGDTGSPAERERLVQRPPDRQLRGDGRHVGFRRVRSGEELLRPGQRLSLGERDMHGQGREYRVGRLRAQIRRDCTAGDGYAVEACGQERLVQPLADRQLRGHGRDVRAPVLSGRHLVLRT